MSNNGTLTFNCVTMVLRWIPGGTRKKCYREINIGGLCLVIGTTLDLDVSLRCPFSVCPMIYEDFRSPITFHSLTFSSIYPCIYEQDIPYYIQCNQFCFGHSVQKYLEPFNSECEGSSDCVFFDILIEFICLMYRFVF